MMFCDRNEKRIVEKARATRAERQSMAVRNSPTDVYANVGKQIKEGRHVGLDFYDLLIEAHDLSG
jgi:hypothetical protein